MVWRNDETYWSIVNRLGVVVQRCQREPRRIEWVCFASLQHWRDGVCHAYRCRHGLQHTRRRAGRRAGEQQVGGGVLPIDGQSHSVTVSVTLSAYEQNRPFTVIAGSGNGSYTAIGVAFAGSGMYVRRLALTRPVHRGYSFQPGSCCVLWSVPHRSMTRQMAVLSAQTSYWQAKRGLLIRSAPKPPMASAGSKCSSAARLPYLCQWRASHSRFCPVILS